MRDTEGMTKTERTDMTTISTSSDGRHSATIEVCRPSTNLTARFALTWRTQVERCCGQEIVVADWTDVPVCGTVGTPEEPFPVVRQCGNCGSLMQAIVRIEEL